MRRAVIFVTALLAGGAAAPANASKLVTLTTPSRFVDAATVAFNGANHPKELRVNVLLPDGFDQASTYPVLYLLHGVGDAYDDWADPRKGDVAAVAKGFPGIIVMPEAARGFFTDWFNGNQRANPSWESYYLKELVPFIEEHFPIRTGRRWHAIFGFSMGGFGATYLASQRPGYFGSVATSQGFVSIQRPETEQGLQLVGGVRFVDIFGPRDGFYATGHNPVRLTDNLRSSRLYVTVGDGTDPGARSSPATDLVGGPEEAVLKLQSEDLVAAAHASGVDVTYAPLPGVHDWPFRRDHLRDVIAWGLFNPVPQTPPNWTYRTVAQHGEMWGLRYDFAAPPTEVETFRAASGRLSATGSGTVTIRNNAGCSLELTLPFDSPTPSGVCELIQPRKPIQPRRSITHLRKPIQLRVTPQRAVLGRTTRFSFHATTLRDGKAVPVRGATVRLGRAHGLTDAQGRVVLKVRLSSPKKTRRPTVTALGLLDGSAQIAVRRARHPATRPR